MRIVTLIASATEIVCSLGLREKLVGRSHECDYPRDVAALPQCTSPKFPTDGTSYQIDERIKAIVQEGLSVYRVDAEILERLQPTHLITQDQCEVCAVSLKDVEAAVCEVTSSRPKIVSLHTDCLADLWRDIQRVAEACGVSEHGRELCAHLQKRMRTVADAAAGSAARAGAKQTVACIEWIDPLMSAGNWMPELIEMAGGRSLFGEAGKHSPWMTWDELRAADPEVLFVSPCGFDIERTKREMRVLEALPGWRELRAVRNARVVIADGNQYFHRPGPRLVESLEIMAEILHPTLTSFGHMGRAWVRHQ